MSFDKNRTFKITRALSLKFSRKAIKNSPQRRLSTGIEKSSSKDKDFLLESFNEKQIDAMRRVQAQNLIKTPSIQVANQQIACL